MKYVVVYLIKGKAKKYQTSLTNKLSRKFNLKNLNKSIMPHLTLKYFNQPVDGNKLNQLEIALDNFSKKVNQFEFNLFGFGNFDEKVIFIKTQNKNLDKLYRKFTSELNKLKWIKWRKYEKMKHNFHATLNYINGRKQFKEILKHLSDRNPNYKLKFDNIAILTKPKDKWIIYKEFKIK